MPEPEKDKPTVKIENDLLPGKWIPQYLWNEMPGIDKQHQRAHYLRAKNLVPVSFLNVVLIFGIRFSCWFLFFFVCKTFFLGVILAHLLGIILMFVLGVVIYSVWSWAITRNAPELKEEMSLNEVMNVIVILLSFYVVFFL